MDDNSSNNSGTQATCCCGRLSLHNGVLILSTLTVLFSFFFITFETFFGSITPWWVWGGTITGIVGGLLGCFGSINRNWYKITFAYLLWAMLLSLWWAIFVIVMCVNFSEDYDWKNFWDMLWSLSLFIWTGYTCYVINAYYKSIKPMGSRWNAFAKEHNQTGYNAIE